MSNKETSTAQSYIDQVTGAAQSVLGSITGNRADTAQGEQKKDIAEARDAASHAGTNIGGVSISSSGVAANNPDRQTGSWNQTTGSFKEGLGGLVGSDSLKREGQQQNAEGKAQEAGGQLSDLGSGVKDRLGGTIGGAVAGLTGDREEQLRQQAKHDQGKTLQRGAESDINRQN